MNRIAIFICLWLGLASSVFGADPFVRVSVEQTNSIVPGQQVHVTVDVFAADFFTSPPQFPLFDLENAIVTLPDERAQNMVETVDGVQFSGIRRAYAVIPEATGTFFLPAALITFGYSQDGKPLSGSVTLPPATFTVAPPDGGGAPSLKFTASNLMITQTFDRDVSTLKAGDGFVRTITVFAEGTQAMMMPALDIGVAKGLVQYSQTPRLADGVAGEGRTTGSTRIETISYVAKQAGSFEVPTVSLPWFDADDQSSKIAKLPSVAINVTKSTTSRTGLVPKIEENAVDKDAEIFDKRKTAIAVIAFVCLMVFCVVAFRSLPRLQAKLRTMKEARKDSERHRYRSLLRSIAKDDPVTVYRNLGDWATRSGFPSIARWADANGEAAVREVDSLQRELFGPDRNRPAFSRNGLANVIRTSTNYRISHASSRASPLPSLNPHGVESYARR